MSPQIRRLLAYIGPYRYNPYLIFLFFFAQFFSRFIPLIGFVAPGSERSRAGGLIIVLVAIPALIFATSATLLNRYRFWSSKSTLLYILEVALFVYLNILYIPLLNSIIEQQIGHQVNGIVPFTPAVFVSTLILTLLALALLHRGEQKVIDKLSLATDLVKKLETEREELIEYDERLRRQTSQFLHDRVQSDLMVVSMKLKSVSGQSSEKVNDVLDRAILRLEKTRTEDLRIVIQELTPNLEAGSLSSALDVLLEQYREDIEISVLIDEKTESLNPRTKLGIFRIVEQSVLNSLLHGKASRVQLEATTDTDGTTVLAIADDGAGASLEKITAGVGSAIIDSWVAILNGVKEIDTMPDFGFRVQVTFPK